MALLYYSKNDSKMKEHIISSDAIDRARAYWRDVDHNVRLSSEPTLVDIEFKEGVAPVYKWECGKYCDYSPICPSPLNKEFVKQNRGNYIMRPLSTELGWIYISGDGKKFLNEEKAREHQRKLKFEELKKQLKLKLKMSKVEVSKIEKELEDVGNRIKSK